MQLISKLLPATFSEQNFPSLLPFLHPFTTTSLLPRKQSHALCLPLNKASSPHRLGEIGIKAHRIRPISTSVVPNNILRMHSVPIFQTNFPAQIVNRKGNRRKEMGHDFKDGTNLGRKVRLSQGLYSSAFCNCTCRDLWEVEAILPALKHMHP